MKTCNDCMHLDACRQWYPKLPDSYHNRCEYLEERTAGRLIDADYLKEQFRHDAQKFNCEDFDLTAIEAEINSAPSVCAVISTKKGILK